MKIEDIIELAQAVSSSKSIKRTGWIREKIKNPESVADHSFRVVVLCMVLANHFNLDQAKLTKMAIIHDLGETKTGDLVVERGSKVNEITKKEKEKLEEQAIRKLTNAFGSEYHEIFHEMIQRKSKEAKFFWQIDKIEMAIQAKEYEKEQGLNGKEFYDNALMHIEEPILRKTLEAILNS